MGSVEYLSKDILEEEFLKTFAPYHFVQKILGSCRVDARNRFVTAPTVGQRMYTALSVIILIYFYVTIFMQYYEWLHDKPTVLFVVTAICTVQLSIFLGNLIHVRFINGKSNMELYIKMQEIERLMKIDKDKALNSLQYKAHLGTVITVAVVAFGHLMSFFSGLITASTLYTFIYCESTFTLELSHCSNILLYFAMRIRYVNAIISNHINGETNARSKNVLGIPTTNYLKQVAAKTHDFKSSETDIYLREIIRGFNSYKNLYRFQILLFCAKIFFYILLSFECIILSIKYNLNSQIQLLLFGSIIAVDFMAALFLCIRSELFIRWVKKTKLLSISVMSIYVDGPIREKAKRMYNIIEQMPPNFSIYDMWNINARLMLSLFNVITSFIVTLLQFAFL